MISTFHLEYLNGEADSRIGGDRVTRVGPKQPSGDEGQEDAPFLCLF